MTGIRLNIASCNLQNLNEHSALHKIENFIHALKNELALPDIVALQEIGADAVNEMDRAVANVAFMLIEALYAKTGISYQYVDIAPIKNSTGGAKDFNIRPAFLIRSNILVLQKYEIGTKEPAFTGNESLEFKASRNPLVITIQKAHQKLTLINCHLKSQNSRTNHEKKLAKKQRNQQAMIIQAHYNQLPNDIPIVVLGDFNDTPNSDTLKQITGDNMTSIWELYPNRLYTTKHRNCPVTIDYILVSKMISFSNPQIHHINTNLKSPYRFSDHDPISVEIQF